MKIHGSIGMRSKTWPHWTSIVKQAQIGLKIMQESIGKSRYPRKRIFFSQVLQEDYGYTLRKLSFCHKIVFLTSERRKNFIFSVLIFGLVVVVGTSLEPKARLSEAMWYVSLSIRSK